MPQSTQGCPGGLRVVLLLVVFANVDVGAPSTTEALSSESGHAASVARLLAEPNSTNHTGYNTTNGCFVEYVGATWDSKQSELLAKQAALESSKEDEYQVVKGTARGVCYLSAGIVLLLFGERFFKPVLFFLGFAAAGTSSLAGLSVVVHIYKQFDQCPDCCTYMLVGTMVGAVMGGAAVLWLVKLCYVILGGTAGGALGYGAYILVLHNYSLGNGTLDKDGMFYLCVCLSALIGAIVAVKRDRALTIFTTSLVGGLLCLKGFDAIVLANLFGRAHLDASIDDIPRLRNDNVVRWMMLAWPLIALLGAHFQRSKTKKPQADRGSTVGHELAALSPGTSPRGPAEVIKIGGVIYAPVDVPAQQKPAPARAKKNKTPHNAALERMRERERMRRMQEGTLSEAFLGGE